MYCHFCDVVSLEPNEKGRVAVARAGDTCLVVVWYPELSAQSPELSPLVPWWAEQGVLLLMGSTQGGVGTLRSVIPAAAESLQSCPTLL